MLRPRPRELRRTARQTRTRLAAAWPRVGVTGVVARGAVCRLQESCRTPHVPLLAQISTTVTFPGLSSGYFKGCMLIDGDMAAKSLGKTYQLYVVVGCRTAGSGHQAANYVAMYTYTPVTGRLSGASPRSATRSCLLTESSHTY